MLDRVASARLYLRILDQLYDHCSFVVDRYSGFMGDKQFIRLSFYPSYVATVARLYRFNAVPLYMQSVLNGRRRP